MVLSNREVPAFVLESCTRLAALAAASMLSELSIPAKVKWPNDIMTPNGKICGILAESGNQNNIIALGIGLNLELTNSDLKNDTVQNPATSMLIECGRHYDRGTILPLFLRKLEHFIILAKDLGLKPISEAWQQFDFLAGRDITIETPDGPVSGKYSETLDDGRIAIICNNGQKQSFWSGDVTLSDI